ncbi:fatty acid desaturase family protein [uncultured Pseudoteredinibacter sp.]|uniref:fatty acid desaturase family protein n=1 Tax=uncultured Pseudoteredinibacter sp. TaxID=1641701 RepID=UPI002628D9DC|nr:fatty acid desaturase family protein [uncultured Pseudoteredinibacter sp.]
MSEQDLFAEGLQRQSARRKLTELLGEQTIKDLHRRSNWMGLWSIASCWGAIAIAFGMIVWAQTQVPWLAVATIIVALAILGGRQLGLAILMHEASHRALFENVWLNDNLSNWLCGHIIFLDVEKYRKHHFVHHAKTGTSDDIDYSLIRGFPTSRASLVRKLSRDFFGITGFKNLIGVYLMNAGYVKWTVASDIEKLPRNGRSHLDYFINFLREAWPSLVANVILFILLWAIDHPELYLAWFVAYLSPYLLFTRIRALAEHAMTEQCPDMLKNTRSTKAGPIARALFAPFRVNYHIEHHALASIPYWQLPKLHKLLREKNAVPKPPGYWYVLKLVSSKDLKAA